MSVTKEKAAASEASAKASNASASSGSAPGDEREPGLLDVLREGDLSVVALGIVLLLGGWAVRDAHLNGTARYTGHGVTFQHPKRWVIIEGPAAGTLPKASAQIFDSDATATFQPKIMVRDELRPQVVREPAHMAEYVLFNLRRRVRLYHFEKQKRMRISGRVAFRIDYSYAMNPGARPGALVVESDIPVVVRAVTVVIMDGDRVRRVTILQSGTQRKRDATLVPLVLRTLRVTGRVRQKTSPKTKKTDHARRSAGDAR